MNSLGKRSPRREKRVGLRQVESPAAFWATQDPLELVLHGSHPSAQLGPDIGFKHLP